MSREDEFWELKKEYKSIEPPAELLERMTSSMADASKAAHSKRVVTYIRRGAIAAAAAAAVFVLPNSDAQVAKTMGEMPLIGGLMRAVTVRDYKTAENDDDILGDKAIGEEPVISDELESPLGNDVPSNTPGKGEDGGAVAKPGADAAGSMDIASEDIENTVDIPASEITDEVSGYINTLIGEFKKDKNSADYLGMPSESRVITDNDDWFTLGIFINAPGPEKFEVERYYHILKSTGAVVTLEDIFEEDADFVTVINQEIEKQISQHSEKYFSKKTAKEYDDAAYFTSIDRDNNFYFDENGNIVIVFDAGAIAPTQTGVCHFTISRDIFEGMLKSDIKTGHHASGGAEKGTSGNSGSGSGTDEGTKTGNDGSDSSGTSKPGSTQGSGGSSGTGKSSGTGGSSSQGNTSGSKADKSDKSDGGNDEEKTETIIPGKITENSEEDLTIESEIINDELSMEDVSVDIEEELIPKRPLEDI